jgi:thioredoxin-related protein
LKRVLFLLLVSSTLIFADGLNWRATLSDAISVAKKQDKIIMVFVQSDYCRWCKKMKNRTFINPNVVQRLLQIEVVKVMRDDYDTLQDFPSIRGVPTIFFITSDKKIVGQIVGYVDPVDFLSYLDDAQAKAKKLKEKM